MIEDSLLTSGRRNSREHGQQNNNTKIYGHDLHNNSTHLFLKNAEARWLQTWLNTKVNEALTTRVPVVFVTEEPIWLLSDHDVITLVSSLDNSNMGKHFLIALEIRLGSIFDAKAYTFLFNVLKSELLRKDVAQSFKFRKPFLKQEAKNRSMFFLITIFTNLDCLRNYFYNTPLCKICHVVNKRFLRGRRRGFYACPDAFFFQ